MTLSAEERATYEAFILSEQRRQMRRALLAPLFDRQRCVINDPSRRKATLCSRRAGKTTLIPRRLFLSALEHKGTLARMWAITRLRAKELLWEDLRKVNAELNADARFNETELSIRLPDDSWIRLSGADKIKETEKKLGDKMKLAIADEAQVYPDDALENLVEKVAGPALEDLDGTFELYGTPGIVCGGLWWEIARDDGLPARPGWSVHRWSVLDNPMFPRWAGRADWQLAALEWLRDLKTRKQWGDDHPTYLREWCGRWVNDTGALVYKYDDARNGFDGVLPPLEDGEQWSYTAGSDLGKRDAFAIVVWAFNKTRREAYEAYSFTESGLHTGQWEEHWERVHRLYGLRKLRVDTGALGGSIVDGVIAGRKTRPGAIYLPLEPAQKTEKFAHIGMMNGDMLTGLLKINRHGVLAGEMRKLSKDPDDETREDERFPNHACDAGLYGYRDLRVMHFLSQEQPDDTRTDGEKKVDAYRARVAEQLRAQKEKPFWDRNRRR